MQTELPCAGTEDDDVSKSKNTIIFGVIRSKLSSTEKIKLLSQYLKEGADINSLNTNDKNNTLLHVATVEGEVEIVKLLLNKNADATITNDDNDTVLDIISQQDTPKSLELALILHKKYGFQKRLGTSGIRGQLYETKLLSLILFRALYDEDIKEFILGTNIEGIGALDDIILRYNTKYSQKTKMLFMQAKHRENEIISVDDLLNPKKDTNLHKYFESYVRVRQKFITDNDNTMFQGMIKNIDCNFVIYTSAKQYNSKNKNTIRNITLQEIQEGENLVKASKTGKVLQFKYTNEFEDFAEFVSTASKTRAIALAQSLIKFLIKDNSKYKNMMLDNLISEYHIYLAQNIVNTKVETSNDTALDSSKVSNPLIGRFHSSFLTSDSENLQLIKFEIYKELAESKGLSPILDQVELNNIMKSHSFKLPSDFGNHQFSFGNNKAKQQNKLIHICSIFEKIFQSTCVADSKYIYVHLDDDLVGPDENVQRKDLGNHWLGGLVGNLLIYDDETEVLKFNLSIQNLSEDNIKIIQQLKVNRDITQLSMFRFNINFLNFPKLALNSKPCGEYDRKLVKHFLDNLRIYTNQAKEDEVENVLKHEICTLYKNRKKNPDFLFHIQCDAIFLTVHDSIQKWWKEPISAPYLTEKCQYYQEVEREILNNPVLSVVHFICCKNINNSSVDFEQEAIDTLKVKEFLNSKETTSVIVSNEINFTTVKLAKYFNKNDNQVDYKFINLDFEIVKTCYDIIINELKNSTPVTFTLVVLIEGCTDVDYWRLYNITEIFKGKIIIITKNNLGDNFKVKCPKRFFYRDTNNYSNLSKSVRKIIREEREIIFQGFPIIVNSVFSDSSLDLFSPALLWKIIHKDRIVIGNKIDALNYFITRNIRAINTNYRFSNKEEGTKIMTLKNVQDKIVIINAEPGMGKSTLLNYLAITTKRSFPNLWILRINLLESHFLDQFSIWKEGNLIIDMVNVMMFLYSSIDIKYYTNNDICMKISKLITVNNLNEVQISVSDDKNMPETDLSEIKLFNYFYNHDKLIVLLDGFDEICPDYTVKVLQLLKLLKNTKIRQLWVTSRPYSGLKKLELALETFSFTINPLDMEEQREYLCNVWSEKLCLDETSELRKYITNFHIVLTYNLHDCSFTSTPLNLYMISEIFENLLADQIKSRLFEDCTRIPDLNVILNFVTLYEKYTEKAFHMQYEKNNSAINSKDPYRIKLKQDAYKLFTKNHKNVAAYLLLDKSIVLSEYTIESIQDFIKDVRSDIEKTNIITYKNDNPMFVHHTFTEYFAVEFLFDEFINLSKRNSDTSYRMLWQYMIDNILLKGDKQGIRKFINSKLQRNPEYILTSLKSKEEYVMTFVFDVLLAQFKNLAISSLLVAIKENFEYIAVFLIECIKTLVNKSNLSTLLNIFHAKCNKDCVICLAIEKRNQSVIKHLIELFTKKPYNKQNTLDRRPCKISDIINKNKQSCISLNTLIHCDQLTVYTVRQFLTTVHEYHRTPTNTHYVLGRHGFLIKLCHDYIAGFSADERLQLFSDYDLDPSVHDALKQLHENWSTVGAMNTAEAKKEEFIKMCMTLDVSTIKSIMLMLKRFFITLYSKRNTDVEGFLFETLPKLESNFGIELEIGKRLNKYKVYISSFMSNLLLIRLLFNDQIKEFTFSSSVEHIGTVLRYKTDDSLKPKMIFLQLQNSYNFDGYDCRLAYFQIYLLIREKFRTNKGNTLFEGAMKDLDYKFIVNKIDKTKFSENTFFQHSDENSLIKTSDSLKIFQYIMCNKKNIEYLVCHQRHSRAVELGKYISTGVSQEFMMKDNLMKIYHIFIAEKIIKKHSLPDSSLKSSIGRFRLSFLTSDDKILGAIRNEIYKYRKYAQENGINLNDKIGVENEMKKLKFVLPPNFGEYCFSFSGNDIEQQEKLDRLLSFLLIICKKQQHNDSEYTVVEFDDFTISSYNLKIIDNFHINDLLESDSLAGLVGDLLIFDEKTEALKINLNEESLSKDSIRVLEGLKQNFDVGQLGKFRFDINIHGFPKLSLNNTEYDRKLATDFLNNLQFYTNQANEIDVEDVLKQELYKYFCVLKKHNDFLFRVKCDAIFFSHLSMSEHDITSGTYSTKGYSLSDLVFVCNQ